MIGTEQARISYVEHSRQTDREIPWWDHLWLCPSVVRELSQVEYSSLGTTTTTSTSALWKYQIHTIQDSYKQWSIINNAFVSCVDLRKSKIDSQTTARDSNGRLLQRLRTAMINHTMPFFLIIIIIRSGDAFLICSSFPTAKDSSHTHHLPLMNTNFIIFHKHTKSKSRFNVSFVVRRQHY